MSVQITVKLGEMRWGYHGRVFVQPESDLGHLRALCAAAFIENGAYDPHYSHPYIDLYCGGGSDISELKKNVGDLQLTLSVESMRVHAHHIDIDIDILRNSTKHFTLVYMKNISQVVDLQQKLRDIWTMFVAHIWSS